jgi:antitoxin CcdA
MRIRLRMPDMEAAMSVQPKRESIRRATNLSIDAELLDAARKLSINLSRAAEEGISLAVRRERERQWLEENREALESYNAYIDANGLPLAKYRQF